MFNHDDLTRRAFAAYFRTGGSEPPARDSGVVEYNDKLYVVLRHAGDGVLAVYRVRNNEILRRMRRWPPVVAEPLFDRH
jgi:hypothetical protein